MEKTILVDSPPIPIHPDTETDDRISNLPDPIIHHILSFLDYFPEAVQTRFLSRRWRYISNSNPNLKIYSYRFGGKFGYLPRFVNFVNKELSLRDDTSSDIHRFDLGWYYDWDDDEYLDDFDTMICLHRWITHVVKRNVQELILLMSTPSSSFQYQFPCLFTCESLTKLELNLYADAEVILPHSMCFPRLKSLRLENLSIKDEELTDKMFSNCPVLESLVIKHSDVHINISSRTLEHFELMNTYYFSFEDIVKTIKLNAPNLTSFVCHNYASHDYSLENLSSLVTAYIESTVDDGDFGFGKEKPGGLSKLASELKEFYARNMVKLLRALHNVKDLTISPWFIEVLVGAPDILKRNPIEFWNMRGLNLQRWCPTDCFHVIAYLLKSSPNIEYFTLIAADNYVSKDDNNYDCEDDDDYDSSMYPSCEEFPLYHLKLVNIRGVQGRGVNELKYLEILLKNAIVLEKVVIDSRPCELKRNYETRRWEHKSRPAHESRSSSLDMEKFTEKLCTLPRASSNVEFLFLNHDDQLEAEDLETED